MVFIAQKDDQLFVVLEGEGPGFVFNDQRAVQSVRSHGMKMTVPERGPTRIRSEFVLHLAPRRNGALAYGRGPIGVGSSTLVDAVPINLSSKTIFRCALKF